MENITFISKKELLAELGISKTTYWRICKHIGIEMDAKKIITRAKANEIKLALLNAAR